ncbi:hypothetical protein B0T20DRAFT_420682 [Sordaria brevicollis]|uniref:Uncharacterized protein n=1 Tax=Sordaria brevicollis TaxID=83679 RepID=A0AAE0P312_SORBR|nr:hypothetical protein B0T20DRAFT_420682 [Sordaria brevicollis]
MTAPGDVLAAEYKEQQGILLTLEEETNSLYFVFPAGTVAYPDSKDGLLPPSVTLEFKVYARQGRVRDGKVKGKVLNDGKALAERLNLSPEAARQLQADSEAGLLDQRPGRDEYVYGGVLTSDPINVVKMEKVVMCKDVPIEERQMNLLRFDYQGLALDKVEYLRKIDKICRLADCELGQTNPDAPSSTMDQNSIYLSFMKKNQDGEVEQ